MGSTYPRTFQVAVDRASDPHPYEQKRSLNIISLTHATHAEVHVTGHTTRLYRPPKKRTSFRYYGTPLPLQPKIKNSTHITRNMKNNSFAIPADAAAIPPNPNTAAMSAIIKNVTAQPNMVSPPSRIESHELVTARVVDSELLVNKVTA